MSYQTYPRDLSHFDVLPEPLRTTARDLSDADRAMIAEVLG